jgi:hypothetical protein
MDLYLASLFSGVVGRGQARLVDALRMTAKWHDAMGRQSG